QRAPRRDAVEQRAAEAFDSFVRRHAAEGPRAARALFPGHQLQLQPVVVRELQKRLAEAPGPLVLDAELLQPLLPEVQRARRHHEGGVGHLAAARPAPARSPEREERHGRPWLAGFIAEIEMVYVRRVKVYGHLDQAQ